MITFIVMALSGLVGLAAGMKLSYGDTPEQKLYADYLRELNRRVRQREAFMRSAQKEAKR